MTSSLLIIFNQFGERVGTVVRLWNQGSLDPAVAMKEITDSWISLNQQCEDAMKRDQDRKA